MSRVFATRPQAQNREWAGLLRQQNYEVVEAPLLEIAALVDKQSKQLAAAKLRDLDLYQKVIFVSQNAVEFAFHYIDEYWPQMPIGIEWFAVGNKTLANLQQELQACAVAPQSCKAMNSENLLELPALQNVKDERILICRGLGGRTTLSEVLGQRQAKVDYCELYQRLEPAGAEDLIQSSMINAKDYVCIFSGETLYNFKNILERLSVANWQFIALTVPGERVKKIATNMGFTIIEVADNASEAAMLRALQIQIQRVENP